MFRYLLAIAVTLSLQGVHLAASEELVSQSPIPTKEDSGRVIVFPDNGSLGTVYYRERGTAYHYLYEGWQELGSASGSVRIPDNVEVRLDVTAAGAQNLKALEQLAPDDLAVLVLAGTDATDDSLTYVAKLNGLQWLDLSRTRISDSGISKIATLSNLKGITFQYGVADEFSITDEALKTLSTLTSLRSVHLGGASIGDQGLRDLSSLCSLTRLTLDKTNVTDEGLEVLPKFSQLEYLSLQGKTETHITDAALISVGKVPNLQSLSLAGPGVTNAGLAHLHDLRKLTYLSLQNTSVTEDGLFHLIPLSSLKSFRFYGPYGIKDAGAQHLAKISSLRELSTVLEITSQGLSALKTLDNLETLYLAGSGIGDDEVAQLASMPRLKAIEFRQCPVTDAGLQELAQGRSIERLSLFKTKATVAGLRYLGGIPTLKHLDVYFEDMAPAIETRRLETLKHLEQVVSLEVAGSGLAGNDLPDLSLLRNLQELSLGFVIDDPTAARLSNSKSLRRLYIERSLLTDAGLAQLAKLDKLEVLDVRGGFFTNKGLQTLKDLDCLQRLYIGSSELTDEALRKVAMQMLALREVRRYSMEAVTSTTDKDLFRRIGHRHERVQKDQLEGNLPPLFRVGQWINTEKSELSVSNLQGKVALIDFWATWCAPCRASMPQLRRLQEKYRDRDFIIIGVHASVQSEEMEKYVRENRIQWPMGVDIGDITFRAWHIDSLPSYFLIDRNGILRFAGIYDKDLEPAILMLLNETTGR